MGARCFGFDVDESVRHSYENDPSVDSDGRSCYESSGMIFRLLNVDSDEFWAELNLRGRIGSFPPPDIIHASPPCRAFTSIGRLAVNHPPRSPQEVRRIDVLIERLRRYESTLNRPVVWQIENVPDSRPFVESDVFTVTLCGTMMGHRVFRHRLFYCN